MYHPFTGLGSDFMAEAKKQDQDSGYTDLKEWDQIFIGLTTDLYKEIVKCAHENVMQVLELSKNFLEKDTHQSLREFHDLYFGEKAEDDKTEAYNQDVSDFVEHLQNKIEAGEDISAESDGANLLKVSEQDRLQISQMQKQMESLIVLDKSLKEKLSPVLASMQFEDQMRQRLEHLLTGYKQIIKLDENPSNEEINGIIDQLEALCSSQSETTEFYEEIKEEEAPKDIKDQGSVFTF